MTRESVSRKAANLIKQGADNETIKRVTGYNNTTIQQMRRLMEKHISKDWYGETTPPEF
jgi:uncharacterized protein YerC